MDILAALVRPAEQSMVRLKAQLIHESDRSAWVGPLRPSDRLSYRVSTVVAAIAPQLPPQRLALLLRLALWSFLVDDRFDKSGADLATLDRQHEVDAVTAGNRVRNAGPLAAELMAIQDQLSSADRTGELLPRFGAAVRAALVAHVRHTRLAREVAGGVSPSSMASPSSGPARTP